MPDDQEGTVTVTGRRRAKASPFPVFSIDVGGGGITNGVFDYLSSLFRDETTFLIDPAFSSEIRKLIAEVLKRINNYPALASAFASLVNKDVKVRLHPETRPDQIQDNDGGIFGLSSDGTVSNGATLDIYIRTNEGGPLSQFRIATIVVHELIHALGIPAYNSRLDAPGSTWDNDVTKDLFMDYQFSSADGDPTVGLASVIGPGNSGDVIASNYPNTVLVGSDQSDVLASTIGGNMFIPREGNNEIQVPIGGELSLIKAGGDTIIITLPSGVSTQDVQVISSNDGNNKSIIVRGRPEISIEDVLTTSSTIQIKVGGQVYPAQQFSQSGSTLNDSYSLHIDYYGEFNGGSLGTCAIGGSNSGLAYKLAAIDGDYDTEQWHVNIKDGDISASFYKPDLGGSQFTNLTIVAGDGVGTAAIYVTIRWAYSNESSPTL